MRKFNSNPTSIDDRELDFPIYGPKVACVSCDNYISNMRCKAFLNGIPEEVLNGSNDHHSPIEGDNGIQWVSKEN